MLQGLQYLQIREGGMGFGKQADNMQNLWGRDGIKCKKLPQMRRKKQEAYL